MGALDLTADDSTDDTDSAGTPDMSGVPQGALQKYVDAASDTSGVHNALTQVAQALKANRQQNQIQALFAAAGALGAPTRTGSIGETAANLGKTLSTTLGDQNTATQQGAVAAAKLQLDEEKAELASRRALGVQALKAMSAQNPLQKKIGQVVLGAPDPHTGAQQAYRYVADPQNPGQLTYQVIPIQTAKSMLAAQQAASAPPAAAPMPDEGDIGPNGQIVTPPAAAPVVPATDGTLPLRPTDASPMLTATGTPADIMAAHGAELKAKGIDISGLDQSSPIVLNMENGDVKPAPPGDPLAKYNGLTGQPLLDALSPADRAEVQAIHDGRVLAPVTGTRAKEGARLLALTTAAYPDFDAGVAKAKFATRQAFAPGGKQGMNFASIDTVMNHLGKYAQGVDDIDNTGVPVVNAVKNAALKGAGYASPSNLNMEATAVSTELMKAFRNNTAGSTKDIEEWRKSIDPNASPDQQAGTIKTGLGLVVGRLEPLVSQWNQTMGENRSVLSFVSPAARQTFMKLDPSYQLTDDDKAFLASQEMQKRKTGTLTAPPAAVARVAAAAAPGPSSATGGKPLPASTLTQYQSVPTVNKAAARAHLQSLGYDVSGLK